MKNTVAEILNSRKIGNIGKHSTLQDVISKFGEPNYVRWDGLYFYNNVVFRINKINKKIASITILKNSNLPFSPTLKMYKRLNTDLILVLNMKIEEIKQYLKVYNIEIYTNEDEKNLPVDEFNLYDNGNLSVVKLIPLIEYYPKNNKYFTELDPKFEIVYDFMKNEVHFIKINYNYRSKRRY